MAKILADSLLELSLWCSELPFQNGHTGPSTMLSVLYSSPEHGFWTPHSSTEVVIGTTEPIYLQTINFYLKDGITIKSKLQFVVYKKIKPKTDNVEELGSCFCFVGDLVENENDLMFDLQNKGEYAGHLHILVVRQNIVSKQTIKKNLSGKTILPIDESLAQSVKPHYKRFKQYGSFSSSIILQTMYNTVISKTYRFPAAAFGYVSVRELMFETCLSFHVPISFLKICIDEETKKIAAYQELGELSGHWNVVRHRRVTLHKKYIEQYQTNLNYLMLRYHAPYFKRSADKTVEDLSFVATNLHLQKMLVESINNDVTSPDAEIPPNQANSSYDAHAQNTDRQWLEHDIITVGATTMHSMGYKQGGLLGQLANSDENGKSKKGLPLHPIAHCLASRDSSAENFKLNSRIKSLSGQVLYQIEKLRTIILKSSAKPNENIYSSYTVSASHEALVDLSQKVCELTTCSESSIITTSISVLNGARPIYRPLYDNYFVDNNLVPLSSPGPSVTVDGTQHVASFNASVVGVPATSPELQWEELNLSAKSTLADVVKLVHGIITPDLEEKFLRGEVSDDSDHRRAIKKLSDLQNTINTITRECELALTFGELTCKEQANDSGIVYRRRAVFSQALSLCICGVSTLIASSLNDQLKLRQFAEVGILLQVESLLSTYGHELGMLQDYAVGVMDLSNVAFKCVRTSQQPSRMTLSNGNIKDERYLPTLHGTPDAPIVRLNFDDESFAFLPENLQKGRLIKIYPVIYNIGINEEQTLAEKFGTTALQDYLNMEAVSRTLAYYNSVCDACPSSKTERWPNPKPLFKNLSRDKIPTPHTERGKSSCTNLSSQQCSVAELLTKLEVCVHTKKNKNVEVLQLAADICRHLNGVRVTSCKSAKDRTAMAVTLEQARILANEHKMEPHFFNQALSCMRSQGTRRENTLKNTGSRRYAFTSVQLMTFPKLYKPPDGTYGKNES